MSTRGGNGDAIARAIFRIPKFRRGTSVRLTCFGGLLMAMRAVIPLYVIYAIYLYWTLPIAVRYSGGGY